MSLKNSKYSYQQKVNNKNAELLTTILKENDSLYSSTTICLRKSYVEDMGVAVYYDKSYRIKKIQAGVLYEFSNK